MTRQLVLGTRGSALALAQTELVANSIRKKFPKLQISQKVIRTSGDWMLDLDLRTAAQDGRFDKGLFTKELEQALFAGTVDVAIHSLKDLPTRLPEGLMVGAVLPREDERDVLISKFPGGLEGLPQRATVATGSLRRQLQLQHARNDLQVIGLRGNVPTRIDKLAAGDAGDAIVLAAAGLLRLGYTIEGPVSINSSTLYLQPLGQELLPAVSQGVIGLECTTNNQRVRRLLRGVRDGRTQARASAERSLLASLGGGCQMPLGVKSSIDGDLLSLQAVLFAGAHGQPVRGQVEGTIRRPVSLGSRLAEILKRGK